MFGDITRFLLDTIFTLFGAALLLRAWTQAVRLSPRNPLSQAIFQLTGWLVHPLRRVIPATGYIDWASLVATYLTALVYLVLLVSTIGISPLGLLPFGFLGAVFIALKWAFNVLVWVTLVSAVLSWVAPHSPMGAVLGALVDPLLRPIRRVLPPLGGLDLSPLVLLVVAQVVVIALSHAYPLFM
ncbi:YggT family protein [uncultured Ralstonia sp.]|jgi:YggT family protein|uniref:YggT family protein n=1 Tax=Ralstonia sp. TaxID=54061 RepID=UPI0025D9509F|nr:YggT family protein [uncultured Ralstonia sp.]